MRTTIILLFGFLFFTGTAKAQKSPSHFFVQEDIVKPSMNSTYLNFLKNLKEVYQKHNINLHWNSGVLDDNSYIFLIPMQGLDIKGLYKTADDAQTIIGKEAFAKLWADKGKCIESESQFVIEQIPQFSYLKPAEGENFRHIMYWYPLSGKEAEADQIAQEWIELYKVKKAPNGYLTYKVVFGREPHWAIVTWGTDEMDYLTKSKKTWELFGEEGSKLWARTMAITKKIYRKRGWALPDLSYTYDPVAVK